MSKLKISILENDKPVAMTIKMPAKVHRDLLKYAALLKAPGGHAIDPGALVSSMLTRFMATDREFRKHCRVADQDKEG